MQIRFTIFSLFVVTCCAALATEPPNVVIVLADDLGYGDVVEIAPFVADDLIGFVSLSGNHQKVPRLKDGDGDGDGFRAVTDLANGAGGFIGSFCQNSGKEGNYDIEDNGKNESAPRNFNV